MKLSDCPYYRELCLDSELTYDGSLNGCYRYYSGGRYNWYWKCNPYTTQQWVSDNYGTRWYYQEPVYTYYYYRLVDKTATSDPTGKTGVSSVVKWVKYREK